MEPQDFPDLVIRHFGFLRDFGFELACAEDHHVVFARADLRVAVSFDPRGCLDLDLTIRGVADSTVPVAEVEGAEGRRSIFVTAANLETFVQRLGTLLRLKYDPVLRGDLRQIEELVQLDMLEQRERVRIASFGSIRRSAAEAWRLKDCTSVVRLLKPIEASLTLPELRRLAYASKRGK